MKHRTEKPIGYRILGKIIGKTDKAMKFKYYNHELWIPYKVLIKTPEYYCCPIWAIVSAIEYKTKNVRNYNELY